MDESSYSAWDNFLYKLKDLGLFTAAGQARECSTNADLTINPANKGSYNVNDLINQAGCSDAALFNIFDSNWKFYKEFDSKINFYINFNGIVEVYCCPYEKCSSDSDCINMDEGNKCNTNYGSCYSDLPSHETKLYDCNEGTGQWQYKGKVEYGEDRFCSDDDDNNYLDKNGGEHCRESSYSSVTDGTWCPSGPICGDGNCEGSETQGNCPQDCGIPGECSSGQTQCDGFDYRICLNEQWGSWDKVVGKCGYTEPVNGNPDFQINILSVNPIAFTSERNVNVNVKIKNIGDSGEMKVETGLYLDDDITSWGFTIAPKVITNCEPNEINVKTKLINLNANEEIIETFTFTTPKVCRQGATPINDFDVLSLAFINCKNTGQAVGVTDSDRYSVLFTPKIDCTGSCTNGIHDGEETDTDCGGSECDKCINGWKCKRSTDCESGICTDGFCSSENGNGNGDIKVQEAITIKQLKSFTSADLAKSMCTSTDQCKEGTCLSLEYLEDKEYITSAQTEDFFDDTSKIVFTSTGAIIGATGCAIIAGAASLTTFGAGVVLFPLCALIGAGGGLAGDMVFNSIMDAFASEDKEAAGFCIKDGADFDLDSIFGWAAWFDIDGNGDKDGIDGMIIVIIGVVLLMFLSRMMVYGRFKYEI